jgi:hypothetical protein
MNSVGMFAWITTYTLCIERHSATKVSIETARTWLGWLAAVAVMWRRYCTQQPHSDNA